MPRGHSLSIYVCFSGKKRTSLYISQEKAIIITSKHSTTIFFSHNNRKVCVNAECVYQIVFISPGHPIMVLKSNSIWPPYR